MIRRPPRSTQSRSSAASDVYKRQVQGIIDGGERYCDLRGRGLLMQPLGGDMPVALGKQQAGKGHPLTRGPKARAAQKFGNVSGHSLALMRPVGRLFHVLLSRKG